MANLVVGSVMALSAGGVVAAGVVVSMAAVVAFQTGKLLLA